MRNVSRAWAYETGLAAGVRLGKRSCDVYQRVYLLDSHRRIPLEIPLNEYYEYFGPEYELDVRASNMDDLNTPQYLERIKRITLENLRHTGGPPSVQVQRKLASGVIRVFDSLSFPPQPSRICQEMMRTKKWMKITRTSTRDERVRTVPSSIWNMLKLNVRILCRTHARFSRAKGR